MAKKIVLKNRTSDFFNLFGLFISSREIAVSTRNNYHVLAGALSRFEQSVLSRPLSISEFSTAVLSDFITFYRDEPQADGTVRSRSHNTVCSLMRCLRTFFNWCIRRQIITTNPFTAYTGSLTERYASPFYLTVEERDAIAAHDFADDPKLAVQRDIFIFQCLTGCRVSDLMNLSKDNIVGGYLEYIAIKTAGGNPAVIRVPLHPRASAIIAKYAGSTAGHRILPFIQPQRFNYAIKQILTRCGIVRNVSLLCPATGRPIRRPINEVAASHMARRTFIGTLYRQIKDPNLINSLTGHADNSRAFNRYRTIDDDIKRELIMLL